MQFIKTALFLLLTIGCFGTSFAQKGSKIEEMAREKTEKLNKEILAGDAEAGLTAEQATTITSVFVQMVKDVRAAKKTGGEAAEIKEAQQTIRKNAHRKVHQEIMTKTQRKAKQKGKE